MQFESCIRHAFFFSTALFLLSLSEASAGLGGSFRLVDAGRTTNPLIYPGPFDTWVFDVENIGLGNVEAIEMHFQGSFLNTIGNTAFRSALENPKVFGFEAPETFFVTRPTIADADVLIAPGTLVDTATKFAAAYTVAGGPSLLNTGEKRAVAFFSVPAGTQLGSQNVVRLTAAIDGSVAGCIPLGVCLPPEVEDLIVRRGLEDSPPAVPPIVTATLPVRDDRPLDELVWSLDSFTGPVPIFDAPTLDEETGLFTWNFSRATLGGTFLAVIRATDADGLWDTGVLTILPAPEPASMILFGLAWVGVIGAFRFRVVSRQ